MGDKIERRGFLRGVGILASAAATTALIERPALAQNASQTRAKSMTFQANEIIDFHSHHIPARFEVTAARDRSSDPACPLGSACTHVVGRGPFAKGHPQRPTRRARRQYTCPIDR